MNDFQQPKTLMDLIEIGGQKLFLRKLQRTDLKKGFLQLLSQLTQTQDLSQEKFDEQLSKMMDTKSYEIVVIEDLQKEQIISSGAIFIKQNLFENSSDIENIVTDSNYRGKGLAKLVIESLIQLSKERQVEKIQLYCNNENKPFYEKLGFQYNGLLMSKYL